MQNADAVGQSMNLVVDHGAAKIHRLF